MNMKPGPDGLIKHRFNYGKHLNLLVKISMVLVFAVIISACASKSGGYYKDDGPHSSVPANIASIPNATPKLEQHRPANFRPYTVFGVRYDPIGENQSYQEKGMASWYGKKFHGKKTANGETYDMYGMTAAHPTLPLPSYAKVTRPANGRSVIVRINDRGPFHTDRIIDLSYAAASKLGIIGPGSDTVIVEAITNNDILAGKYNDSATKENVAVSDTQPPAPVQTAHQSTHTSQQNNIYLQFGAFSSSANAQALVDRINSQSGVSPEVSRQADLYKVRLGPYQDRNEATQAAEDLQNHNLRPTIAIDVGI